MGIDVLKRDRKVMGVDVWLVSAAAFRVTYELRQYEDTFHRYIVRFIHTLDEEAARSPIPTTGPNALALSFQLK